jgi:hypothetical protein
MTKVDDILTIDNLTHAIRKSVGQNNLAEDDAKGMAHHMMNFFGYNDRIIDNVLEPEDRDVFYQLEDSGLLVTEREETTLYDGREWRINYWLFRKDKIRDLMRGKKGSGQGDGSEDLDKVYEELPEDAWQRD